jgi:hypothetical protein
MQHPVAPSVQLALTLDRGLRLDIEPGLLPLLGGWAPVASSSAPLVAVPTAVVHTPAPTVVPMVGAGAGAAALVRVVRHRCPRPESPAEEPHVRHGAARAWMDDERGIALLHGVAGGWGQVMLAQGVAEIVAPSIDSAHDAVSHGDAAADLRAMCTIAVALLAGRREGVLVAASAVIAPDGGGWLLVGEASSGKSTTAAHLVTAGWGYLADEEVLLHAGNAGSVWLEGWPRALPLDGVWPYGRALASIAGRTRGGGEPSGLARARWRRTAPLAGIISTQLAPDLPTLLTRATTDEALASLVRATPWLLADSTSTRYELGLLRSATRAPGWRLRLGRDTHGDVARLAKCMRPLEAAS